MYEPWWIWSELSMWILLVQKTIEKHIFLELLLKIAGYFFLDILENKELYEDH